MGTVMTESVAVVVQYQCVFLAGSDGRAFRSALRAEALRQNQESTVLQVLYIAKAENPRLLDYSRMYVLYGKWKDTNTKRWPVKEERQTNLNNQ